MTLKEDIVKSVDEFFYGDYEVSEGIVIPDVEDIKFGKFARALDLAMLFIDIKESTKIVNSLKRVTAARMYKSFLFGVARIAKNNNGELRSFNGDGVLVAFNGKSRRTNAVKASLQMTWFVNNILKPKMMSYFENKIELQDMEFDFGIGIDEGRVLVVRGGIRGENNNDLVWVGNATNYSVKLASLSINNYRIHISENVYKSMNQSVKSTTKTGEQMWEPRLWTRMNNMTVYRSKWQWPL
jgi:adenylate cyclase